jgi:ubiquinone/menaquinone biosynthesis C-methylase UbiE
VVWPKRSVVVYIRETVIVVDRRYKMFGWDYEFFNPLTNEEINWYRKWAQSAQGPLLGLACGTGRLLCRLAKDGHDVIGIDLSDTMLSLARKNIKQLPPKVKHRITLKKTDMSNFNLDQQFGMVFIADNSFRELRTRKDLLRCLRCVHQHLKPEGKFLITERRFDPSLYHQGQRFIEWSQPRLNPQTHKAVLRKGQIRISKNHKRIHSEFLYKTIHADGSETFEKCSWSSPLLVKCEYVKLFKIAGFDTQTFVGYKKIQDDDKNPTLCFVCNLH